MPSTLIVEFTPDNQLSQCLMIETVDDDFLENTEQLFITFPSSDDAVQVIPPSIIASIIDNDSKQ